MKRQADGIKLSDDIEPTEENGNKRIKLLSNEVNKENFQTDHVKEKSMMDVSVCENSDNHNCEDTDSFTSNKVLPSVQDVFPEKEDPGNYSIESTHEVESTYGSLNKITNNCNGSCDKTIAESLANDSGIVSELNCLNSLENSVYHTKESELCGDKDMGPPSLNRYDHDLQSNESTDSFQSEGFDAQNVRSNSENSVTEKHKDNSKCEVSEKHIEKSNCEVLEKCKDKLCHENLETVKSDTNNEIVEKYTSPEQDNNLENEISFESDLKKTIDVENLTLSHLKVIELQGHTEEVLSVAADEDFILSSSADTTTKVWNIERQNIISTFSGHSNTVTSVLLLNPNQSKKIKKKLSLIKVSRIAMTGSLDCQIKLWSVLEGKELASVYTFNGITCLGYLESECLVVVGTEGGKIELWNLSLKEAVVSERAHEDKITDIKVIDNYIYSVSVDGSVKVWSYEDEDLFPIYSRKRKEISSDKSGFKPALWNTVAVSDNVMYLGDSTNSIKKLDWKAGRISLFKNQTEKQGVCNCVVIEENILFSSYYDLFTKTSGINAWKLPEMTYICTIAGTFSKISSLTVVQKENKLKVISGGNNLFVCEFDFSKPPSSEGQFYVREYEMLGNEINENPVEIKKDENNTSNILKSKEDHSKSSMRCNIM